MEGGLGQRAVAVEGIASVAVGSALAARPRGERRQQVEGRRASGHGHRRRRRLHAGRPAFVVGRGLTRVATGRRVGLVRAHRPRTRRLPGAEVAKGLTGWTGLISRDVVPARGRQAVDRSVSGGWSSAARAGQRHLAAGRGTPPRGSTCRPWPRRSRGG